MSNRHKYPYEAQQEINELERQLEEARNFIRELLDVGEFNSSYIMDCEKRLDKLKEKGK